MFEEDPSQYDAAIEGHRRAAAIFRRIGDRHGLAAARAGLGLDLLKAGRMEDGVVTSVQAVKTFFELGDYGGADSVTDELEHELIRTRRFQEVITTLTQLADHYEERGDWKSHAVVQFRLYAVEGAAGRTRQWTRLLGLRIPGSA